MYVTTKERLEHAPMLSGDLAETLGANPLPDKIKKFLNEVRKRAKDFKGLLLNVIFHPLPHASLTFNKHGHALGIAVIDEIIMMNIRPADVLDPLRRISNDLRQRDERFKQQIESELRLRKNMFKTTGALFRDAMLRTKGDLVPETLKPFLLRSLLYESENDSLGLKFAKKMLHPRLFQRITQSAASEAHFFILGMLLRRYAEVFQRRDAAFKQLVEEERKKLLAPKKKT